MALPRTKTIKEKDFSRFQNAVKKLMFGLQREMEKLTSMAKVSKNDSKTRGKRSKSMNRGA